MSAIARLALVLAIVNATVALAANKWRDDRPNDRFPGIVQDAAVIVLFVAVGTMLLREQLLATSAVGAMVLGFALQDTLGNLFAGMSIQIEKPFRVGHWIQVGGREGQVHEITWRATKLRTKAGQFLIVPNSVIAKDPVLNFSEPTVPTCIEVEVGASYGSPPNAVKRALLEAVANASLAMRTPVPVIEVKAFGASSIDYVALFWIEDYATDGLARDQVRTEAHVVAAAERLGSIDLFATQSVDTRHRLATSAAHHLFAAGEAMVRQDAEGDSMFVLLSGRARVTLEPLGQEVAIIPSGGFFGEMSMLTGDRRTATVRALDDVQALEISAADFRELAVADPVLLDHISSIVTSRRAGLDEARAAAAAAVVPEAKQTLLARMRKFLQV